MKHTILLCLFAYLLQSAPVVNLNNNWTSETIYESELIYGEAIIEGANNEILILGRDNKVFELSDSNTLIHKFTIQSENQISTIAYQPKSNRYIFLDTLGGLYQYSQNGNIKLGNMFNSGLSSFAIDNDDSIYTCHMGSNAKIQHYDKDGRFISDIANGGNCFQIALNSNNRMLYFSNTVEGSIYQVELNSENFTEKIVDGVGIPGTFEPIGVALDDGGGFYFFPSNQGLKHYNGSVIHIKDAIGGGGSMIWSKKHEAFLMLHGSGANVLKYNLDTESIATNLDYPVNSFGMAENKDGIFFCSFDRSELRFIPHNSSFDFISIMKDSIIGIECDLLENDITNNIYVSSRNGELYKINGFLKKTITGLSGEYISSLEYDKNNNILFATTRVENNGLKIWKINLETLTASLFLEPSGSYIVRGSAVDESGNFYFTDTLHNKIYKVDRESKTLSVFIDNPIDNLAIVMPDLEFLPSENGLLLSQIEDYKLFKLNDKSVSYFARNNDGVDSFTVNATPEGKILTGHSGRFFYFTPKSGITPYILDDDCFTKTDFETLPNGWSLIGSSCKITDFSLFDNAQIVWAWDNTTSKWYAYSHIQSTMQIIKDAGNIEVLNQIESKKGFWVKK